MTFYEAAVEVLRRSGRPLHFKKITEVAIRDELLSHVGKTPESTMEDRLDQETKKDDTSWIVRTRPGVYMLKSDVAERLNEEAQRKDEEKRKKREETRKARKREEEEVEEEEISEVEDDAEVDEVDEDDEDDEAEDEDDESKESEDDSDDGRGRGRRRRRRRGRGRGRGKSNKSDDKSDEESSEKSEETEKPEKSEKSDSDVSKKNGRARDEDSGGRRGRRGRRGGSKKSGGDKIAAGSFDELDGERYESMANAAFAVLDTADRKPMRAANIAEIVFDKKLVKFHTHDPEATIESAIVTDNQVRARSGRRPLFAQYREGRWGLTQWGVSDAGIKKEQQILALAGELRQQAADQLSEAIARLKPEAFEMVVMTLLERLNYCNLKVSKRTADGDTYFSADWRRGFSDLRVCVHVASDAEATLDADAVVELRDTLEHYSAAEGIIVHVGEVSKDAVRASRNEEEAKVTIIDRKAFVQLLIDEGIGVRTFQTPLVMVDSAFIDALQR